MRSTARGLVSALAAITIAGSTLIGLGASAHAAGAARADTAPSLLNAPVPASCKHPATTLDGYEKDYPASNGHATLQVDQATSVKVGRDHRLVTIVPLSCSARGKAWPDLLLAYASDATLLDSFRLRTLPDAQALGTVTELHRHAGRGVQGTLTTATAGGYDRTTYTLTAGFAHGRLSAGISAPLTIEGAPDGATGPGGAPTISGPHQSNRLEPAPAGLRSFLQRERDTVQSYVRLDRYSHKMRGFALVVWNPGDEEARVAAKVKIGDSWAWRWLATYWDRGQEQPECADVAGTVHRAWAALGLTCNDDGTTRTLGDWPTSGL